MDNHLKQGNVEDDEYTEFLNATSQFYANRASQYPIFQTDAQNIWERYLGAFVGDERQHHNCKACRHFIERYAGLVLIDPVTGQIKSALWNENASYVPENYRAAVKAMREAAERAKVVSPFYSELGVFGTARTGTWTHLWAKNSVPHRDRVKDAHQVMADKRQDFLLLRRALEDYPQAVANQALSLLEAEALYRSERFIGPAKFFHTLHVETGEKRGQERNNIIWLAVAQNSEGFTHIANSVIGTLLDDIKAGLSFESVKARFAEKTRPSVYQHAQAAPKAGAIELAEKLFEQLGLAPALPRRYAAFEEVAAAALWPSPKAQLRATISELKEGGVFGHLRAAVPVVADLSVPPKTVTWEKFSEKVLPTATKIEVVVPRTSERFMALTTAVNADASPILQWDHEKARNPFSWYYASGVDAEMRRRVESAGGQYTDVDIRVSLMWEGYNDLDLHCITPAGRHIHFADKRIGNGELDVDANANCCNNMTLTPVENIRWPKGLGVEGTYQLYVHHYATNYGDSTRARTPFRVEIEVNGEVFHVQGETNRQGDRVDLPRFEFQRGESVRELRGATKAVGEPIAWGVTPGTLVPVTAIVPSPNMWPEQPLPQCGQHVFFLLHGVRDSAEGVGRGFFTEQLKSDLRPVRAVLEAHLAQAAVEDAEQATACGIGISLQSTGDLVLRVTSPTGQMLYKLDRWD